VGAGELMKELDAKDRQLLALLAEDARQPLVSLARKIHLSRSATQERMQRLKDAGVLLGYAVRVHWGDGDDIEAWLMITFHPGIGCTQVAPRIMALPGIELCHALGGMTDLLVLMRGSNTQAISAMRDQIAAFEEVSDVTTHFVLAKHR
jgi:DNA-binding Lrp family transcriptional regulator